MTVSLALLIAATYIAFIGAVSALVVSAMGGFGILLIATLVTLASAVSALVMAAVGGFFGTSPLETILGVGPRVGVMRIGTTVVSFKLIPLGGAVVFADADTADADHVSIAALPWVVRAMVSLSGPLVVMVIGSALAPETASASLSAIFQAPRLFTDATGVVQKFDQWARTISVGLPLAASVFLITGAVALLPVPPFNVGHLLLALLEAMGVPKWLTDALTKFGILAYVLALVLITIAIVRHMRLFGG